jgi:HTH-type transcriptional regulator / antitoxin HigA
MRSANQIIIDTLPKTYVELVKLHMPRPINDDAELENVIEVVDRLAVLKRPTRDQRDYLELLTTLVEKYESEHHAIDTSHLTRLDRLKFLLASHDMSASDLGRVLGQRELGPKILSGKRELSKAHIRKLAEHFQVTADTFL